MGATIEVTIPDKPGFVAGQCSECGEWVRRQDHEHSLVPLPEPEPPRPKVTVIETADDGPFAQAQPGPWEVRVSARILHWPGRCACCCGPAECKVPAECRRLTGVRVIRVQTKHWEIPYCQACGHHVTDFRALMG